MKFLLSVVFMLFAATAQALTTQDCTAVPGGHGCLITDLLPYGCGQAGNPTSGSCGAGLMIYYAPPPLPPGGYVPPVGGYVPPTYPAPVVPVVPPTGGPTYPTYPTVPITVTPPTGGPTNPTNPTIPGTTPGCTCGTTASNPCPYGSPCAVSGPVTIGSAVPVYVCGQSAANPCPYGYSMPVIATTTKRSLRGGSDV